MDYFGGIRLTFGFCSRELAARIAGRIAPALDQHAACELNARGKPICPRLGAAVDFLVPDESMLEVARWIAANTPFDRLYYYGDRKPVHVSASPEANGAVEMGRAVRHRLEGVARKKRTPTSIPRTRVCSQIRLRTQQTLAPLVPSQSSLQLIALEYLAQPVEEVGAEK